MASCAAAIAIKASNQKTGHLSVPPLTLRARSIHCGPPASDPSGAIVAAACQTSDALRRTEDHRGCLVTRPHSGSFLEVFWSQILGSRATRAILFDCDLTSK